MKVDDLFTLSELDDVTVSPDGAWIAVSSAVNVRHLWAQIFDWLDTHLGGVAPKAGK